MSSVVAVYVVDCIDTDDMLSLSVLNVVDALDVMWGATDHPGVANG